MLSIQEDGSLVAGNRYDTIPSDWTEFNSSAAIRLSSDNKFLYVSNRGHNSITVFEVSADGQSLTEIQNISTEGDFPLTSISMQMNHLSSLVTNSNHKFHYLPVIKQVAY